MSDRKVTVICITAIAVAAIVVTKDVWPILFLFLLVG